MSVRETPEAQVKAAIERVAANKSAWAKRSNEDLLSDLREIVANVDKNLAEWTIAANKSRGLPDSAAIGAFITGGQTAGFLNSLIETYTSLAASGKPPAPKATRELADHKIVQVMPSSPWDAVLSKGERVELVIKRGQAPSQGKIAKAVGSDGALCGILGAGNYESPLDILTKMFVEKKVVVYKSHPNLIDSTGPFLEKVFAKLIKNGFLAIVEGAVAPATTIIESDSVDELLMTGGAATYDRIMWGADPETAKKTNKKLISKPFEAELGASSPWVLVPGKWTDAEIKHHAEFLLASKMLNSGAVCASPQNVVVDADWPQLQQFQDAVLAKIKEFPDLPIFYGGSCSREMSLAEGIEKAGGQVEFPQGKPDGDRNEDGSRKSVKLGIAKNVSPDAPLLHTEAFAPILGFVPIKAGGDPKRFLELAVPMINEKMFGTLSMSIMIHPETQKSIENEFNQALIDLRYGAIAINQWGGMLCGKSKAIWGAYPIHTPEDIQSGCGQINNAYMFDNAEKSILWSDFVSDGQLKMPSPALDKLFHRVTRMIIYPSVWRLFPVLSAAVLGL